MTRPRGLVERLRLGDEYRPWLDELNAVGAPPHDLPLPSPAEAAPLLERLGVPPADAALVLTAWPSREREPELWWLLARCYHVLVRDLGGFERLTPWPSLPPALGPAARFFYVYVFTAALADVRGWHEQRSIPDEISWATLADLGRNMAIHRRMHGEPGLDAQDWLTLHFRGGIYELGRLQFNRGRLRYGAETIDRADVPFRSGDAVLGVHIPEAGPLAPAACDASFAAARAFFGRHFADEPYRMATCTSWLLDDQLAEYLEPASNILRFQRRFRLLPGGSDGDADIFRFVFRRPRVSLDDVPQRTTLERAVVAHLRSGRHWRNRTGWIAL